MPIVTSSFVTDAAIQAGGGQWTREIHTDDAGRTYELQYLWDGATDRNQLLAQHATYLNDALAEAEAEALLGA